MDHARRQARQIALPAEVGALRIGQDSGRVVPDPPRRERDHEPAFRGETGPSTHRQLGVVSVLVMLARVALESQPQTPYLSIRHAEAHTALNDGLVEPLRATRGWS